MKFVEAGGARISAIGLGTWQFGSTEWGYGREFAGREAGAIVTRALELGVNLIDTAEVYGLGRSERIVGEAIRGRRDQVFIATKIFPIGLPFMVESRARGSARRLRIDHIDL
ncbi:MAG TPA: aldo/keto reductase, partial [Solirubrobacteraceae bacterium]